MHVALYINSVNITLIDQDGIIVYKRMKKQENRPFSYDHSGNIQKKQTKNSQQGHNLSHSKYQRDEELTPLSFSEKMNNISKEKPTEQQKTEISSNNQLKGHLMTNSGAIDGSYKIDVKVPLSLVALIIGKGGETIKRLNSESGAFVCLSNEKHQKATLKIISITGTQDQCVIAKQEVQKVILSGLAKLQNVRELTYDEEYMMHALAPIALQLQNLTIEKNSSV